jgi:hypothetical protein
MDTKLV